MAISATYASLSCAEASAAFECAAVKRSTFARSVSQDVLALQAIADILGRAVHEIAALFSRLDAARRSFDANGATRLSQPFLAVDADEYALVEALFWDRLSDEAELLLKTLLRRALSEVHL